MRSSRALAIAAAPGLALLLGAVPLLPPAVAGAGCSARPGSAAEDIPDWGFAVDGELVATHVNGDAEGTEALREHVLPRASEIRSAQIVCWAAVERMYDVRLRHGVYSVWTHDVFAGAEEFLEAAHALVLDGGDVSELTPPHAELVVTRHELPGEGAFRIDLTHPKWQWMCRVSSVPLPGDPDADHIAERRASRAGEPGCFSLHDHGGSGA